MLFHGPPSPQNGTEVRAPGCVASWRARRQSGSAVLSRSPTRWAPQNYSAKCTFTLTPAEQKTIIAGGTAAGAVYLAGACGPTALACLAAAAAVVATASTYMSENVRANCDLVVYTIPNPIGTGVIVRGAGHKCP